MEDKKSVFSKKEIANVTKVEANIDVEISKLVEEEVKVAIEKVIDEASKKYFRNISVKFSIDLK